MSKPTNVLLLPCVTVAGAGDLAGEPNPTALASAVTLEDVDSLRSVCCPEYDDCLNVALRHAWRGWSCSRCALFTARKELRASELAHRAALRPFAATEHTLR